MIFLGILGVYFIIVLLYVIIYFFIIYHLAKYSLNASLNRVLLPIFIVFSTLILISNIMLFFGVDWKGLTSNVIF